jgi:hypothetical protein
MSNVWSAFAIGLAAGAAYGMTHVRQWRGALELAPAVAGGITCGVLFAGATWWADRERRRKGLPAGNGAPVQERDVAIAAGSGQAIDVCVGALNAVRRATIQRVDKEAGRIDATVGGDWRSFGERVTVVVKPVDAVSSVVTVRSVPRWGTTVVDWGKGAENVDTFVRALRDRGHLFDAAGARGVGIPDGQ